MTGTWRAMLWLALPAMAEQLLQLVVTYVDLWMTGNLLGDPSYVAAMTLTFYASWFINNTSAFVTMGATALVARFTGAEDRENACRAMNQSVLLGIVLSVALMIVGFLIIPPLVSRSGLSSLARGAATQYLLIQIAVLPAIMLLRTSIASLRGAGDTISGLGIMLLVNSTNIVVSYTLVTGWGSLEPWGWTGIAVGTAFGRVLGALVAMFLLIRGRSGLQLQLEHLRPNREMIRRLLNIGIPGGVDGMMLSLCHLTYVRVVMSLGDIAAAAHGVAVQIEALGYMPGSAFQIAATTLAGQHVGADDPHQARRSVMTCCLGAIVFMMSASLFFYFGAIPLSSFFLGTNEGEALELSARILRLLAFIALPLAIMMTLAGALRGAGDTRGPMRINLVGMVLIRIPLALLFSQSEMNVPGLGISLSGMGLGVMGAWYAAGTDIALRSVLTTIRFQQGRWQEMKV